MAEFDHDNIYDKYHQSLDMEDYTRVITVSSNGFGLNT